MTDGLHHSLVVKESYEAFMAAWEMTTNALMVSFLFELERAIISCTATEGQNSPHLFIRSSKGRWRWKCECGNIIHAREIKLS